MSFLKNPDFKDLLAALDEAHGVPTLTPTLSAEHVKQDEHRSYLCKLAVHIRQGDL